MLFSAVGKEPFFVFAPLWLFDAIIDSLQWVADKFESEKFENAAELGRIGTFKWNQVCEVKNEWINEWIDRLCICVLTQIMLTDWLTDQKTKTYFHQTFLIIVRILYIQTPTGKYYAVEDMLTTKPEEKFGTITLQEHYDRIAVEGQEYDPYTTMFAKAPE